MVLHSTALYYRGFIAGLYKVDHCSSKVQTHGPPHHIELLAILRYHTHWTPHHLKITYVLGIANTVIPTHPLRDCTCNQRDLPFNRNCPIIASDQPSTYLKCSCTKPHQINKHNNTVHEDHNGLPHSTWRNPSNPI